MQSKKLQKDNPISIIVQLFRHVSRHRRYQFIQLFGLTLVSSFAEVVSLGAVVPFIGILTQPEKVFEYPMMEGAIRFFGISSSGELVLPLTIAFATAAIIAGGLRLLLLKASIHLANATGADISIDIYRRTLYQPYPVHVSRSSSEIITGITQKVSTVIRILMSVATIITSVGLFTAILSTLIVIDPMIALVAAMSFGTSYVAIAWLARRRLSINSKIVAHEQTQVVKSLQEGLGAIRDVLLDGAQAVYCNNYSTSIQKLQRTNGESTFVNQAPRYAMESVGMVLIAIMAYVLSLREGGIAAALPVLGALALGAQRLLPILQILYGNWVSFASNLHSLLDVLKLLEQPLPKYVSEPKPAPLEFKDSIVFDNVGFQYVADGPCVLNGINLVIKKGTRTGFVGSTGSGKSTMLDMLMSLLEPTEGSILIDGKPINSNMSRAWQRTIAHVPQTIFLTDTNIAENIAFGVHATEIDMERVKQAAKRAQIADFIESHPDGYNAFVGERGIRLSGGQRQRIGIARALYKQATVLIFDEATSALDNDTEKAVMSAIENLDRGLTILIIAHRLTTLKNCDTIVQLENGKIIAEDSYSHFINRKSIHENLIH